MLPIRSLTPELKVTKSTGRWGNQLVVGQDGRQYFVLSKIKIMPPKLRTKLSTSTEPDVSQKAGEVVTMATIRELLKAQEKKFNLKLYLKRR